MKASLKLPIGKDNGGVSNRTTKVIDVDIGEVMELQNEDYDEDSSDNMDAYLHPEQFQDEQDPIARLPSSDEEFEFDQTQ